jgi:hypothetical protein
VSGADVSQIAVPVVWLGMVLAISFVETPLKFRAPGITMLLGLGIGRLVFRALAVVELTLTGVLTTARVLGDRTTAVVVLTSLLWAVLVVQVAVLLSGLGRRARLLLTGGNLPRSRLNLVDVALDRSKVVLLRALRARAGFRDRVVNPAPADIVAGRTSPESGRGLPAGVRRRAARSGLPRRRPGGPRRMHTGDVRLPPDPHVGVHDHLARDTWFVRVTATYRAERR